MRKSFTRLLGLFMLFSVLSLSFAYAQPTVTSFSPVDNVGVSDYEIGDSFVLTFSDDMAVASGTGIVGLFNASGVQISTLSVTNPLPASISISGDQVIIDFDQSLFSEGSNYDIVVTSDAFKSAETGLYFAGITHADPWDFTVGDYTPPVLQGLDPVADDEAGDGDLTPTLTLTFDEPMTNGTGSVYLYEVGDNGEGFYDQTIAASAFTFAGNNATYTLGALNELTEYYVRVDANAFQDQSGHSLYYDGIDNSTGWKFRTADVTKPVIASTSMDDAADAKVNDVIEVTFSDNRTAAGMSFSLFQENGNALTASTADDAFSIAPGIALTASVSGNTITLAPPSGGWASQTTYTLSLVVGQLEDNEGNENAASAGFFSFTSGDFDEPTFSSQSMAPAGNGLFTGGLYDDTDAAKLETTDLAIRADVTDASTLPVEVRYWIVENGGSTPQVSNWDNWTVLPSRKVGAAVSNTIHEGWATVDAAGDDLKSETGYDIYLAAKDNATTPNTTAQANIVSVTNVVTNDIEAPVIEAFEMKNKGGSTVDFKDGDSNTNIEKASTIVVTFDEQIVNPAGTDFEIVYDDGSANGFKLINGTHYNYVLGGAGTNVLTVTPVTGAAAGYDYTNAGWESSGSYTVTFVDDQILDVPATGTANPMAEETFTFTVEDYNGPVPVFSGIPTGAGTQAGSDVPTSGTITIDFGEKVTRANNAAVDANNVFFRDAFSNLVAATIDVRGGGQYVDITPSSALDDNVTSYSVEFTSTLKDLSGNQLGNFEGTAMAIPAGVLNVINPAYLVNFTTADETNPVVSFTPSDGSTVVKSTLTVNVTFNETVYDADGVAINTSDENIMRDMVTVENVTTGATIDFDITNGAAAAFDVELSRFLSALTPEQSYKVTVNGLFDAADNAITSNSTTFTVQEYDAPVLVSTSPVDGSADVASGANLVMTFDENIAAGGGNIVIYDGSDAVMETIPAAGAGVSISGKVATITPTFGGFVSNTDYYVLVDNTAFEDTNADAQAYSGISSKTAWNFTGDDTTDPTIATLTPADDSTVPKPDQLVITFTEASGEIIAGGGKLYVREDGNTGIPDLTVIAQDQSVVSISGTTVTIDCDPAIFDYNADYWVEIEGNAFRDAAGNYLSAFNLSGGITGAWNFTIAADPVPDYDEANSDPADDDDDIALDKVVMVKFTEPVWVNNPAGKFLTIRNAADNTAHTTVDFGSAVVNYYWNSAHDAIYVTHANDFDADVDYYIQVTTGTFEDAANQPIPAGSDLATTDLNFTTRDLTPPTATAVTVNGTDVTNLGSPATGIDDNGNIVITFSEPVTIATPNASVQLDGTTTGGAFGYSASFSSNVLTINPTPTLASEETIDITILAGQVVDQSTNAALALVNEGNVFGRFIVEDKIDPTWTAGPAAAPAANKLALSATIDDDGTIYYLVTDAGAMSSATAAYVKDNATDDVSASSGVAKNWDATGLDGDKAYDVWFVAEDHAGNLMNSATKVGNVSTIDNVKPLLTDNSPTGTCVDNQVAGGTDLYMEFNENIAVPGGLGAVPGNYVWVRQASDDAVVAGVTVSIQTYAAGPPVVPAALVINIPQGNLSDLTDYYVEVDPGFITDVAGNDMESYFWGKTAWTFQTADETAPTVNVGTGLTPAAGDVLDANDEDLEIEFSEPVVKGSGYINIYQVGSAAPQEIINVTSSDVTISTDGKTVNIHTRYDYSDGIEYYVLIDNGAFEDQGCNSIDWAGIALQAGGGLPENSVTTGEVWYFIGQDEIAPTVYDVTPADGASDVNVATTIDIEFSEEVFKAGSNGVGSIDDLAWLNSNIELTDGTNDIAFTAKVVNYGVNSNDPYPHNITTVVLTTGGLLSETTYTITIDGSKFEDAAEQAIASDYTSTFTTGDYLAPYVMTWSPANNATGQDDEQVITITFNEPVVYDDNVLITDTNVDNLVRVYEQIAGAGAGDVDIDAVINDDEDVITITPQESMKSHYKYVVEVLAGTYKNLKAKDDYGVVTAFTMSANDAVVFTVGDFTDPTVASYSPNATTISNLTADITINVNTADVNGVATAETMKAGTGTVNIYRANGTVFDIVAATDCDFSTAGQIDIPHTEFEAFTTYYVNFEDGVFTDVAGNPLSGIAALDLNTWRFSTSDGSNPTIAEFITPENGTGDAVVETDLKFRFSENIAIGTGDLVIYDKTDNPNDDGDIVEVISITAGIPTVVVSGSNVNNGLTSDVVTVDISTLTTGRTYYVKMSAGLVNDLNALPFEGLLSYNDWQFSVGDNTPPTAISGVPSISTKETIEGGTPEFTLSFDKMIQAGSGKIQVYQYFAQPVAPSNLNSLLIDEMDVTEATINGANLVFTFDKNIADAIDDYYIIIENGAVLTNNANAIAWAGFTNPTDWQFATSADVVAPVLVETSTNVDETVEPDAVVAKLVVEDYNGISSTLNGNFMLNVDGSAPVAIDNSRVTVSSTADANGFYNDSDTITITFVNELVEETDYFITVASGVVTDASNSAVAFAGIADDSWAFSVNDFTAPVVDMGSLSPTSNDLASEAVTLEMEFSEDVQPGTGNLYIKQVDDDAVVFTATGADATISGAMVSILVEDVLADEVDYYVTYEEGFVTDLEYGAYATTNDVVEFAGSWTFSTDDNVAPEVMGVSPLGTDIPGTVTLKIEASEPVTATTAVITIVSGDDVKNVVASDMTANPDNTFEIEVTGLTDSVEYTVTVPAGAFLDGAVIANATDAISWTFSTGDDTAPTMVLTSMSPENGEELDTYIGVGLSAMFSETVVAGTGSITVDDGTTAQTLDVTTDVTFDGKMISLSPELFFGTYTVTIPAGAILDLAGNTYAGGDTWSFTIEDDAFDASCMDAFHFSPKDGSINQPEDVNLVIDFCEKVVPGSDYGYTGKILVYNFKVTEDDQLYEEFVITDEMISEDGMSVSVELMLEDFEDYGVLLGMGIVCDEAGNPYAGNSDPTKWQFSAGDLTPPSIVEITDAATLQAADLEFNVTIEFSEAVINVEDGLSVDAGEILNVSQQNATTYVVTIAGEDMEEITLTVGQEILDASPLANPLDMVYTYDYKVGDHTSPTVAITVDEDGQIPNDFVVSLDFSEDVVNVSDGLTVSGAETFVLTQVDDTLYTIAITALDETTVTVSLAATIEDASANALVANEASFVVGDFEGPTATVTPGSGDDMDSAFDVTVVFSDDAIVTADDITVTGATASEVAASEAGYVVSIEGEDDATVTISISDMIVDEADNLITGDLVYTYEIGDNTAPTAVIDPVSATDTVNVFDATIYFSEAVVIPDGAITASGAGASVDYELINGNVWKLTIGGDDMSTIVLTLTDQIVDLSGNAITPAEYTYTIGDHVAPTVSADMSSGSDLDNSFDVNLTFSEAVTGTATGIKVAGGTGVVTGSGTSYKVAITANDMAAVTLTVGSAVKDAAGNSIEPVVYEYSVGDNTAPTVSASPADGSGMATEFDVVLTFSEAVTGVASGVTVSGGTKGAVSGSGAVYTVTVSGAELANITVTLGSSITDGSGNALAATSFSYTVGDFDNEAPTLSVDPDSGSDMADAFDVTLTFDESVTGVANAITVSGGTFTVSGSGAVYTVSISTSAMTAVTLAISNDVEDAAGNAFAGASYSYTTVGYGLTPVTIAEIQGAGDASPLEGDIVTTVGVVTGKAGNGFFMQDANAKRSGIWVYAPGVSVSIGAGIQITGTVTEYFGKTEIEDVIDATFVASIVDIVPMVIGADEVGEDYEGVLVTVNGLKTIALPDDNGEWLTTDSAAGNVDDATDGTEVWVDDALFAYTPDLGQRYNITGVVDYTWNEYKLEPRMMADIEIVTNAFEALEAAIDIYPNPFNNVVNITVPSDVQLTKAVITNIAGQIVRQEIYPNATIETGDIRSGLYYISLHTEEGVVKTQRIIKR